MVPWSSQNLATRRAAFIVLTAVDAGMRSYLNGCSLPRLARVVTTPGCSL
jgi:hypothetical protein